MYKNVVVCFFLIVSCKRNGDVIKKSEFVGKNACIQCHQKEFKEWQQSHHYKSMMEANDTSVLGDFNNFELVRNGKIHKLYRENSKFYAITDGQDGEMKPYEIKYTFGFDPIQQYLVDIGSGKLQTLALTWDNSKKEWFYMSDEVYKNQSITHENWLHWTNQSQNWNSMCAECHSTDLKKNYDFDTDTYNTSWSEINVSCEACHGPSSNHIEWVKNRNGGIKNRGFLKKINPESNIKFIENCVRCHSRRSVLDDYNYEWEDLYDNMIPSTVSDPYYHWDGQIKEEDFVYGSFVQSRMYHENVKCNDCHDSHSNKLKREGNELCLQCHSDSKYDTEQHHHHESGSKGSECINCHMPGKYFMGRDFRRDHSFRVPRPDLSKEIGSPNACNDCHNDKSVDWSVGFFQRWYGKTRERHYGQIFYSASLKKEESFEELKKVIQNLKNPQIVRETAIDLMYSNYNFKSQDITLPLLADTSSGIRYRALNNFILSNENIKYIQPLLEDSIKTVRMKSASILSSKQELIEDKYKKSYGEALREYRSFLEYNIDFPQTKMNMANLHFNLKDYTNSEKYLKLAVKQDNKLYQAQLRLAYLYNMTNRKDLAVDTFKEYLNENPKDFNTIYDLGLLLAEMNNYSEAVIYLEKAKKGIKLNHRIILNLAKIYAHLKQNRKAEEYFKYLILNDAKNESYYFSFFEYYLSLGKVVEAKKMAREIVDKFPQLPDKKYLEEFINK